jgi:hypothetical protein
LRLRFKFKKRRVREEGQEEGEERSGCGGSFESVGAECSVTARNEVVGCASITPILSSILP